MNGWDIAVVSLGGIVTLQGILLIGTMRQLGGVLLQINPARFGEVDGGPDVGTVLDFPGFDGRATVVVFVSPDCSVCEVLRPVFPVVREYYPELTLIAAVSGDDEALRRSYAESLGGIVRLDLDSLVAEWKIPGTPFAVGFDKRQLVIARGVVNTLDQLEGMAESVLNPPKEEGEMAELEQGATSGIWAET